MDNQEKQLLFTPGPLQVSLRVREALKKSNITHRDPLFQILLAKLQRNLLRVFGLGSSYFPCVFNATGRGANEAMIAPHVIGGSPLIITNGSWGDNLLDIASYYRKNVAQLELDRRRKIDPNSVNQYLAKHPNIDAVIVVHQETRSGILNPVKEIAEVVKKYRCKLLVDAMSSVIVEETRFGKIGADFFSCSSAKGLRSVPGLGIVVGKIVEFKKLKNIRAPAHYLDLFAEFKKQYEKKQLRFAESPALFTALHEAVSELLEEGVEERRRAIFLRTERFRRWARMSNLRFSFPESELGCAVTTFTLPAGLSYKKLVKKLRPYGIFLLYGDNEKGNQFQVSFMGAVGDKDISLLKKALIDEKVAIGSGRYVRSRSNGFKSRF